MKCLVLVLLGVISLTQAQVPGFGGCPTPPVKAGFNLKKYTGIWYEIERYWPIFFELGVSCGRANYTLKDDGHVRVQNMGYRKFFGKITEVVGDAYAPNASEPAKLAVSFPSTKSPFSAGPYWVLFTDYTSTAVVYSCVGVPGIAHADIIWILGRRPTISDDEIAAIKNRLDILGLRTKPFVKVSQENCPFDK